MLIEGADGLPTAVVNTDMNHEYLGYLQLEFNNNGVIVNDFNEDGQYNFGTDQDFDISVSRAYPGDISQVEAINATNLYDSRIDNLATAMSAQMNDKESRWYGTTNEFLNGQRLGGGLDGVRNQETNLSNLIHDSYIWYSGFWEEDVIISMSNGSGIRASIGQILPDGTRTPNDANTAVGKPEGGISQADIESALAFNNGVALIDITGEQLKTALESINRLGGGDGDNGAYQIGGFAYSFDPEQPEGMQVRNARFLNEDGSLGDFIIENGEVMTGEEVFRMATLGFNAGADGIFGFIENQNRVNLNSEDSFNSTGGVVAQTPADLPNNAPVFLDGSQQDAFAEYLYQFSRNGTEDTSDDVALGSPDTTRVDDERVQILSYREDSLTGDTPSIVPDTVFGTPGDDNFDIVIPGEKMFVGEGQILFTGGGNDTVDTSLAQGGNRIDLGSGDDLIFAGSGDRILVGAGDDVLFLSYGQGDNVVTGGPGADQFWLLTDSQDIPAMAQTITDFTVGEDVIGFATTGFSFADLNITQNGSSTVVTLTETDKDLAILLNTQVSQITESSFAFV